jgi:uncharacterized protein (TIGR02145 family)
MAENLNYQTENSWCGGGSKTTEGDCVTYGRLYTWAATMGKSEDECGTDHECGYGYGNLGTGNVQGVCPDGWHVPKLEEWIALTAAVGGRETAGQKLKATTGWASSGITNEDAYGFAALPAGYYLRGNGGVGIYAYFWSASEADRMQAYMVKLMNSHEDSESAADGKLFGFSVRCLKD